MPNLDVWQAIFLLTIGQGLFQVLMLFSSRRGNILANKILGLVVFMFTYKLIYLELLWTNYIRYTTELILTYEPFELLLAPLFFLYVKQLTGREMARKDLWHFLPTALCLIYMFPFFISDLSTKLHFIRTWEGFPPYDVNLLPFFAHIRRIQLIVYAVGVVYLLRLPVSKGVAPFNSSWLESLKYGWIAYAALNTSLFVIGRYFGVNFPDYWVPFLLSIVIYSLGYLGYGVHGVPVPNFLKPKYSSSGLDRTQSAEYYQELISLMEDQQLYLQSNLKLSDMAQYLGISQNYVSQIVNEHSGHNFPEFINRYRVQAAQKMLSEPATWDAKMLAVAYDCGFNNKVSFYKSFKKFVGVSPLEYKRSAEMNYVPVGV